MPSVPVFSGEKTDYSIQSLSAVINGEGGLAHKNRYLIQITAPAVGGYTVISPDQSRTLNLLCDSTIIPGVRIMTEELGTTQHLKHYPYSFAQEEITFSFLLTGLYTVRQIFDAWIRFIINFETYKLAYKDEVVSTINIFQLSKDNIKTYGVKLINAFPTSISQIDLSNIDENSIQKMDVTFVYDRIEIETDSVGQLTNYQLNAFQSASSPVFNSVTSPGGSAIYNSYGNTINTPTQATLPNAGVSRSLASGSSSSTATTSYTASNGITSAEQLLVGIHTEVENIRVGGGALGVVETFYQVNV